MEMKEKAIGTEKYFSTVRKKKKYIAVRNNSHDPGIREKAGRGRDGQAGGQTQPACVFMWKYEPSIGRSLKCMKSQQP